MSPVKLLPAIATLACFIHVVAVSAAAETELVWLDMTQAELDAAYDQAVFAPNLEQVLARQAANSDIARQVLGEPLRFEYGSGEIEGMDIYPSGIENSPILIYVHGGTWRLGVAAGNAFAAETFVEAGIHFVIPDFSSVDEFNGDLEGLVNQLQRSVAWVYQHAREFGGDPDRIYLAGFSSGAHLAGVLLTNDWENQGLPGDIFKGALLCSGMFDLTPVALSWRSEYVNLDEDNIPTLSALMNIDQISTPLLVAYGTRETPEFQRQAHQFTDALVAADRNVTLIIGQEYNHFEMIETLGNPYGILGRPMLDMIGN